jgi:hypothetical protein
MMTARKYDVDFAKVAAMSAFRSEACRIRKAVARAIERAGEGKMRGRMTIMLPDPVSMDEAEMMKACGNENR